MKNRAPAPLPAELPQLNDAADSEPGDEPPAASPEEGASGSPATAGDAVATALRRLCRTYPAGERHGRAGGHSCRSGLGGDLNLAQMGMPDGLSSAAASDRVGSALPCLPIRW